MAQGKDHIVAGVTIWLLFVYLFRACITSIIVLSLSLVCVIAGSLFPDIDIKSKGQKLFYGLMAPAYIFLCAQGQYALCFLVGLFAFLPILSTHRGLFHRLWFIIAFAALWGFAFAHVLPHYTDLIFMCAIFFMLGSLSHLVLDFGFSRVLFKS